MKVSSNSLRNTTIATSAGNFKVNDQGIADVPDELAQELIADGLFTKVANKIEPKAVKAEETKETKAEENSAKKADK